jgi:hypothetical protein
LSEDDEKFEEKQKELRRNYYKSLVGHSFLGLIGLFVLVIQFVPLEK